MKKLLRFLKGYVGRTVLGPLFKLVEAVFELIVPLIVAHMIDRGIPAGQSGDYSVLIWGGVAIFLLGLFGLLFSVTAQFFASRVSAGFGTALRGEMYAHVNKYSAAELDRMPAPTLVTRLVSDTTTVQNAVAMFIRLVTRAPFIAIGAIIMAIIIDPMLSLLFIAAAAVVGVLPFVLMRVTRPGYREVQRGLDTLTGKTRETLSGIRVIRAFGREADTQTEFTDATQHLAGRSMRVNALSIILNPFTYAVVNLAIIAILYFGGIKVSHGALTQGQVIALINYLTQILHAMLVFANLMVIFSKASASAARINEVFALQPSLFEGGGAVPDASKPAILAKNLNFTYPDGSREALSGIDFTLMPGKTLGILGGTGSGKSTLLNLILRSYDIGGGQLALFGNEIGAYTADELTALIRTAPQKAVLFSGTVRDNLLWGKPDATEEELVAALRAAQAYAFIQDKPGGLDAEVSAGGGNFSGGQRQRLSIARALIGGAPILILDDATSALDFSTEAKVRRAIKKLPQNPTILMVSQRVNTVKEADCILVLDDGRMAGIGTHDELMRGCPLYKEIYDAQVKGVAV